MDLSPENGSVELSQSSPSIDVPALGRKHQKLFSNNGHNSRLCKTYARRLETLLGSDVSEINVNSFLLTSVYIQLRLNIFFYVSTIDLVTEMV